jgi:predicted Rossmann fold flavoprotein
LKTLVAIGGGAAGFFCAVNAARMNSNLRVIILEKSNKLLSKVKVSGGGRCNITHACFDITVMSNRYPRGKNFVKKTFHQFFTTDTVDWFTERGVHIKAEPDGRMFPATDSSQTVIDCLLKEAAKYKVEISLNSEVTEIRKDQGQFLVETSGCGLLTADCLLLACGGYPKSSMFNWIIKTGHHIEEPVPSLFTFNTPSNPLIKLMGISVENVRVKITGTKLLQEGPLLITHWGLSGPAVLKLSAWGARELKELRWDFKIRINWRAELSEADWIHSIRQKRSGEASHKILSRNDLGIPQRLWNFLAMEAGVKETMKWGDLSSVIQNRLVENLFNYECNIKGKTTYKEEFVTAGGVKLNEIDPNTMESKIVPGLYFAGEVMDVDGITGGYNFQHAWTSGFIAAKANGGR